jgi:hypothetical protein
VRPDLEEFDWDSTNAVISGDGTVIAFETDAENHRDPFDENLSTDVLATVRGSGTFQTVSAAADGGEADDSSYVTGISDDGRFVLFQSSARNLVVGELRANTNSFVRDRTTGRTALAATTASQGEPSDPDPVLAGSFPSAISGNGRYVLFWSSAADVLKPDTNGTVPDVYLASNPVPFVFAATPNTVARGATTTVQLLGSGLAATGALVGLGDGITVNTVTPVSEHRVDVSITVAAGAVPGPRTPLVVQAGTNGIPFSGGLTFLPGALTVT